MNISSISANENEIFMDWEMTMIFRKTPSTLLFGATKLTLCEEGRIIHQRITMTYGAISLPQRTDYEKNLSKIHEADIWVI